MESISVFDIFKIGVGPSSSHTMGPWRAAQKFLEAVRETGGFHRVGRVRIDLYGSLAKTGHGHGTDVAVILGLSGEDPVTCEVVGLIDRVEAVKSAGRLRLAGKRSIDFDATHDLLFHMDRALPFHPNGITFTAYALDTEGKGATKEIIASETYYSVGGGFVVQEEQQLTGHRASELPYPSERATDIVANHRKTGWSIPRLVMENEKTWRSEAEVRERLLLIWRTMQECIYRGCHTEGVLPGGLGVTRRAAAMNRKLISGWGQSGRKEYDDLQGWLDVVRHSTREFQHILKWVSTFALAVNEENAAFGRVVTAPTNGAAGVIPAVMMYYWCFCNSDEEGIIDFMLTAGEIGSLFKKGATISAAMGGCQAEIGVSSAMAAAGLCQCLSAREEASVAAETVGRAGAVNPTTVTMGRAMMAAEIAMEHHLGMTCDPIGGLVQVPCIERNTMGAIKAITAANIALEGDPAKARVSLDDVIKTMWQTSLDMQSKYKETAEGGLAVNVTVPEC
ncbi:MAG: L-serine ammonia-lyase [Phycisphaeraceae bacterium]|nr:L-serine ammonia-lyase [Phycisphaeraceae bacterium]